MKFHVSWVQAQDENRLWGPALSGKQRYYHVDRQEGLVPHTR